jgi:hypothetical protein
MRPAALALIALLACLATSCDDGLPSDLVLSQSSFNVYFYYPDQREQYLGVAQGIDQCQAMAGTHAQSLGLTSTDWDYLCCRKTMTSECASKHR